MHFPELGTTAKLPEASAELRRGAALTRAGDMCIRVAASMPPGRSFKSHLASES